MKISLSSIKKKQLFKLIFNIKEKNIGLINKFKSKIFYNLTFNYIKNNFQLINKLIIIKKLSLSNLLINNSYKFYDFKIYNDLFILNYIAMHLNDPLKSTFVLNKNQKPLTIISIIKKLIFSNNSFIRLIKTNKTFLKQNIYSLFFVLFYYFNINNESYNLFLKFNKKKNKKNIFNLKKSLLISPNIRNKFLFFFKNIIMFFYKFSLVKKNKKKMLKFLLNKKDKKKLQLKIINYLNKKNKKKLNFKIINYLNKKKINKLNYKKKLKKKKLSKKNKKIILLFIKTKFLSKKLKKKNYKKKITRKTKRNFFFSRKKKFLFKYKLKKTNKFKIKKNKKKINKKLKFFFIKKILKIFKKTFIQKKKKKKFTFFYKKLFVKKLLVKRLFELPYKKDNQLKLYLNILKNNKKFKFLTFPINSVCKFFFRTSMYNIFMTLMVFPLNLTIANYSGGQFNLLSKRRDRGSINSLKYMTKLIALKIYQSNLSFIHFCPRLNTFYNKRYIKTIFYSFKILNKSPITKIFLYRPVIRNGIRNKKIPRK